MVDEASPPARELADLFARRAREEADRADKATGRARTVHIEMSHRYAEAARRAAAGIVPYLPGSTLAQ